ncbi:hypothetical protein ES319_D05G281900v1 [Gossypium barbadense]|uniref:VQ domain-containing protein n=1 Tax=Gossypium barbadense TaxID=3634 RepID=A0A5J5RJT7_GOSBA|nr:hypothetical protein ES319_D05G281900v1 [Gossypium barbadense]
MQSSSGGDNDFGSLQQFLNPSLVSHHQHHPHTLLAQGLDQVPLPSSSSMQPRPVGELNGVVKNPKKRTRASRKAPTTVLTTDPTNFRAMVQEYTGIPTPPGSSSFSRKLDIFGSGSSAQILQPPLQPSLNLPGCSASASSTMASLDGVSGNLGGSHGNWRGGVGLNDGNQDHFRPFDGIYGNTSQRLNSFKSNYSSISDFQHEKGLENVSSRAQGTVDSWISPAD